MGAWMRAWTVGLDEGNCVAEWVGGKQRNENWLPGPRLILPDASFLSALSDTPTTTWLTGWRVDVDVLDVLDVPDKTRHTAVKTRSTTVDSRQSTVKRRRLPSALPCHAATTTHAMPASSLPAHPPRSAPPPLVSEADARSW
jgi:hypothetical protein